MDGVGGSGRGEGAGRASDSAARAEAAAKAAEKAAEKAAAKKAEEDKKAAQQSPSLRDRLGHLADAFMDALPTAQRERALQATREAPPGSVGAAINVPLAAVTHGVGVGGWCAGKVGDFYESERSLLNSPATRQNVDTFARRETDFFQSQTGCAGLVGSAMSAQTRADILNHSAAVNERLGDSLRQAVNIATDPLGSFGM